MTRRAQPAWLTRDLLWRLMLPLLAIVIATGGLGAYTARRLTDRVFDRWLLDAARSVGAQVRFEQGRASLDLPAPAEAILLYDDIDHTYFSVMQGARLLAGRTGIPQTGDAEAALEWGRAFEARLDGQPVRVVSVEFGAADGEKVTVLVAETLAKRRDSEKELLVVLWPMAALVLAAAGAILIAIRQTIRPLESIAARWNERSHASLQPIGDEDLPRELAPFAAALNDLLARLRDMLARERQFAATAAHQLRTRLAGLQLGLERAAESSSIEAAREVIGELIRSSRRTTRLLQQLLVLGSLDPESRSAFVLARVDLVALAEDVGSVHAEQAIEKAIDFELQAAVRPVYASVEPDLIGEALGNVVDNAIRYTAPGGRVLVEVVAEPLSIRVCDSGPGIASEERQAVFGRFARGRLATGEGSGLGLTIARDIAALHGATVALGEAAWGGTCVTFFFEPGKPH